MHRVSQHSQMQYNKRASRENTKLKERWRRTLIKKAFNNPRTSVQLGSDLTPDVSERQTHRILHKKEHLVSRKYERRPSLALRHTGARLQYAEVRQNWSPEQ